MKKKIGLVLLLIAVVTVGTAFAENGRKISTNNDFFDPSAKIIIDGVYETTTGIEVYYTTTVKDDLIFYCEAVYTDGKTKSWTNKEYNLTSGSKKFKAVLTFSSKIERVNISWERKPHASVPKGFK